MTTEDPGILENGLRTPDEAAKKISVSGVIAITASFNWNCILDQMESS